MGCCLNRPAVPEFPAGMAQNHHALIALGGCTLTRATAVKSPPDSHPVVRISVSSYLFKASKASMHTRKADGVKSIPGCLANMSTTCRGLKQNSDQCRNNNGRFANFRALFGALPSNSNPDYWTTGTVQCSGALNREQQLVVPATGPGPVPRIGSEDTCSQSEGEGGSDLESFEAVGLFAGFCTGLLWASASNFRGSCCSLAWVGLQASSQLPLFFFRVSVCADRGMPEMLSAVWDLRLAGAELCFGFREPAHKS